MAVKAVRGAGQPWGVAEEAGWSVRWLGRAGLPGVPALARAIEAGDLTSILTGISVADRGSAPGRLDGLYEPLLCLPFLSRCMDDGDCCIVSSEAAPILLWQRGADGEPGGSWLSTEPGADLPDPMPAIERRIPDMPEAFAVLTRFAARTYAPATEASRRSGAGAGLTDND